MAAPVSWDHALNSEGNHRKAAEALCNKFGWLGDYYGKLHCGGTATGYVFVFADRDDDACADEAAQ